MDSGALAMAANPDACRGQAGNASRWSGAAGGGGKSEATGPISRKQLHSTLTNCPLQECGHGVARIFPFLK